jgi:hypothetical protein
MQYAGCGVYAFGYCSDQGALGDDGKRCKSNCSAQRK